MGTDPLKGPFFLAHARVQDRVGGACTPRSIGAGHSVATVKDNSHAPVNSGTVTGRWDREDNGPLVRRSAMLLCHSEDPDWSGPKNLGWGSPPPSSRGGPRGRRWADGFGCFDRKRTAVGNYSAGPPAQHSNQT